MEERPWEPVKLFFAAVVSGIASLNDLQEVDCNDIKVNTKGINQYMHQEHTVKYISHEENSHSFTNAIESKERRDSKGDWEDGRGDSKAESSISSRSERKGGRWDRITFKIRVSYDGSAFNGWQSQPGLWTAQGALEECLGPFTNREATGGTQPLAAVTVAGRTDKGVHAAAQVCSFYTWDSSVDPSDVFVAINSKLAPALRALTVEKVPRSFHPNFQARWRHYVYLFPLLPGEGGTCAGTASDTWHREEAGGARGGTQSDASQKCETWIVPREKPVGVHVAAVDRLLRSLEGRDVSFAVFARDTKPGRSRGPATVCHLHKASAKIVCLPRLPPELVDENGSLQNANCEPQLAMLVELVGDRFLRKMVRILVSTAVREAAAGAKSDGLHKLMATHDRRSTAPPAPPQGLCFAGVGYEDYVTTQ